LTKSHQAQLAGLSVATLLSFGFGLPWNSVADETATSVSQTETVEQKTDSSSSDIIPEVPLYSKKSPDVQAYSDVGRGFKLLR